MNFTNYIIISSVSILTLIGILWIMYGMRLNLYFVNIDSRIEDQMFIPITMANKKSSAWRSLFKGQWRENVELTLTDSRNEKYTYQIGYSLWRRFNLLLISNSGSTSLNGKKLVQKKYYPLKNSATLNLGGRLYKVVVSTNLLDPKEALKLI